MTALSEMQCRERFGFQVNQNLALEGVGKNLHNHQASMPIPVTFLHGKNFSDLSIKQLVGAFVKGEGRFRMDNSVTAVGFDTVRFVN